MKESCSQEMHGRTSSAAADMADSSAYKAADDSEGFGMVLLLLLIYKEISA